jgi:hypothetical protein
VNPILHADQFFMQTVNLVRHNEVEPELTKLGADVVLLQDDPDLTGRIRRATGPALAVGGIDPVAGELTKVRMEWARSSDSENQSGRR